MEKYNDFIEKCRSKEDEIAQMAIKQYGSIEKYVEAMKKNFNSNALIIAEQYDEFKKDVMEDKHPRLKKLYLKLVSDLRKDPSSKEIQLIAEEIKNTVKRDYDIFKIDEENNHWYSMVQIFLVLPEWIQAVDNKYGTGASKFIGDALKANFGDGQPKINTLYEKLTADFEDDPTSTTIQEIVKEIVKETTKQNEALKFEVGENYWGYTAELYLTNSVFQNAADKKYGNGAAQLIGGALKYYVENSS